MSEKIIIDNEEIKTIINPVRCTKASNGWCQKLSKKTYWTKGITEDGTVIMATSCHDGKLICGYIYELEQWIKEVFPLIKGGK